MGRASVLSFLGNIEKRVEPSREFPSIDDEYDDLPSGPGAYIIRAAGRTTWPYPWGRSPVFYIGMAKVLRIRLWDHWDQARQAKRDGGNIRDRPVHNYEAAYASLYHVVPTWQRMTPDSLEQELLARFINAYGARPIANGQTRWDRV